MNRTFLVLALALLGCAGCRTMNSKCGQPCGSPCAQPCCEPCHVTTMKHAPRPEGCCEGSSNSGGRGGDLETDCPGGNCCLFDRYHGQKCGPQYPNGPYDCSPCCSPNWGCNGY